MTAFSVCRRMPLPRRLHEGPGPQAPLHPQRVGAQSGVSYANCLIMVYDCLLSVEEEIVEQRNHPGHQTRQSIHLERLI